MRFVRASWAPECADVLVAAQVLEDDPIKRAQETALWAEVAEVFDRLRADITARWAEAEPEPVIPELEPWQLDDECLVAELAEVQQALAVMQGRWLALLAEAERRKSTEHVASEPTASWLANRHRLSVRTARAEVHVAGLLDAFPQVGAALRAGAMSLEQASVIVRGLDRLPETLDADERDQVAAEMVGFAADFGPTELRRLVNHAITVVAPEVAEENDRKALDQAERAQRVTRHLGWRTDPDDGSLRFWGKLPAVEGELLKEHLSALAESQRIADSLMGVDTTRGQALADALALTISHHASCVGGPVKGGDQTRVVVTVSLDALRVGVGRGTLVGSDEPITPRQARRLACSAGVMPLVLDGDSHPLDLGRSQRFFSPAQRVAMAVRDRGCAYPGCDRPPADCEAHHGKDPWHAGGRTDLADGVLLCPHHHHLVEPDPSRPPEKNWLITFDDRGHPIFHSPVQRDGSRITRQHGRYRIRE